MQGLLLAWTSTQTLVDTMEMTIGVMRPGLQTGNADCHNELSRVLLQLEQVHAIACMANNPGAYCTTASTFHGLFEAAQTHANQLGHWIYDVVRAMSARII